MKILLRIFTLFAFIAGSYASELLYQNPTTSNLKQILNAYNESPKGYNGESLERYLTIIFKHYPNIASDLNKTIGSYPESMQKHIAQALVNNETNVSIFEKFSDLKPYHVDLAARYRDKAKSQDDVDHNMALTDNLWMAYSITGKDDYIRRILTFAAAHSLSTRTLAFEVINRENVAAAKSISGPATSALSFDDIKNQVTTEQMHKIIECSTVIWSINSNRRQHPEIDTKVKELIKINPSLDYSRGVKL